jgi:hypothetical protein
VRAGEVRIPSVAAQALIGAERRLEVAGAVTAEPPETYPTGM